MQYHDIKPIVTIEVSFKGETATVKMTEGRTQTIMSGLNATMIESTKMQGEEYCVIEMSNTQNTVQFIIYKSDIVSFSVYQNMYEKVCEDPSKTSKS